MALPVLWKYILNIVRPMRWGCYYTRAVNAPLFCWDELREL